MHLRQTARAAVGGGRDGRSRRLSRRLDLACPVAIAVLGVATVSINYIADRQRQQVRTTGGDCTVWGRKPRLVTASYTTEDGSRQDTILLASRWWGLAKHFN